MFCALVFTTDVARGAVLASTFSNVPPGFVSSFFQVSASISMFPPFPLHKSEWAMSFTPDISGIAERVSVPLRFESGQLRVSLAESQSGVPGAVLDSTVLSSTLGPTVSVYSGELTAAPNLTAGQPYWLIASIEGVAGTISWANAYGFFSGLGVGPVGFRTLDGFTPPRWDIRQLDQAALRIEGQATGSAVPEPTTFFLTGVGCAAALVRRRLPRLG
jgi:hypothetical protein